MGSNHRHLRTYFVLIAVSVFTTIAVLAPHCAPAADAPTLDLSRTVQFDIPAGPLPAALLAFSNQAHVQIVTPGKEVGAATSPGVSGAHTLEGALRALLAGSGFEFRVSGANSISVILRNSTDASGLNNVATLAGNAGNTSAAAGATMTSTQPIGATSQGENTSGTMAGQLEEIIVTAQKKSERLQDVPVPVTALNANTLAESNQLRLRDYYTEVPSFSMSPVGLGDEESLTIRGISTGFNTNPTVGVMIDGVPFGSSTFLAGNSIPDIDPGSLARVEVLRGPQGTLYGASSMGGLVNYVTVDPSTTGFNGYVEGGGNNVSNGNGLGYNVRGAINVPLSSTLAIRVSGFARRDPGYIDNPVTHINGVNQEDASGGHLAVLWTPSDDLSFKLSALLQHTSGNGSNDVDQVAGLGELQQNYIIGLGAYDKRAQAYSAILKAKVGIVDITAVTGYSIMEDLDSLDFTYALGGFAQSHFGVTGAAIITDFKTNKFTQELRALVPLGSQFELLVGGFYEHEDSPFNQDLPAINPLTGANAGDIGNIPVPSTYEEYAAFTDLTYHVTDQFDIQIGARDSEIHQADAQAIETGPLFGGETINPAVSSQANAFTYLLTPRFKVSPDLMLYARLASGYRAGAPNSFNPDPTVPREYKPDTTQNYEIGAKGDVLEHRLSFDASLYYINWKDLQLNLLDKNNDLTYGTNGSGAKSEGVEVSLVARPLKGLKIASWVAWDDAVLTQNFPTNSTLYGAAGDRLPFSSRFSGNLSVDQDFHIVGSASGFVGAAASYVGDRIGTFLASPQRQIFPGYTKADLHAGVKCDSWTFTAYANNVANKFALLGGGPGNFPPYGYTVLQPRVVGISIAKTF